MKIILVILIGILFSMSFVLGMPFHFPFGFLLLVAGFFVYMASPVYCLGAILLFRPALDTFLTSIRFADMGLGGLVGLGISVMALIGFVTQPHKSFNKPTRILMGSLLLFIFMEVIAYGYTTDKSEGIKFILRTISVVAIFVLTVLHVKTKKDALLIFKAIIFSAIPVLLVGVVDFVEIGGRFRGSFAHPNILAYFLLLIIGPMIYGLMRPSIKKEGLAHWEKIYFALLIVSLVMTQTRSGWMAFFLMMATTVSLFYRKYIVYLILVCLLAGATPVVQDRIFNVINISNRSTQTFDNENSFNWRKEQWKTLIGIGMQRPFYGFGLNADKELSGNTLGAHNDYVKMFIMHGIGGVLVYFFPFVYLLLLSWKNKDDQDDWTRKISRFLVAYLPAFLLMSISENLFSYVVVHWVFWAIVGVYMVVLGWRAPDNDLKGTERGKNEFTG